MTKKFSYLTPVVVLLSWVSLLTDVSSELLYPILPVYLKTIGYSFLYIGLLEGFADATAGLTKGYFGNLSDKMGKRVIFIRGGYSLSVIGKSLLILTQHVAGIFMARFTDRLGKGIRTSARDAMLVSQTTKEKLASVFGFHRAMDTLGAVMGPIAALILLKFYPGQYKLIFIISIIPAVLSVLLTLLLKDEKTKHVESIDAKKTVGFFAYLKYWKNSTNAYKALVVPLLLFALVNSTDAFLLLRVKEAGYSDSMMITCYISYNLVYALLSFPIGIFADRIGRKTILCTGFIFFAIAYFGLGLAVSLSTFIFLFFTYAVFAACNEAVAKALLSAQSEPKDRGTALGFYESGRSIASLIASTWTGLLWSMGKPELAFNISAITAVVVVILVFKLDRLKGLKGSHQS